MKKEHFEQVLAHETLVGTPKKEIWFIEEIG